jgi:signal transduction histidine kinase
VVVVEDDGKGLDPARPTAEGNGLVNMQERLEEAGGRCSLRSRPGAGCAVEFRVTLASRRRRLWQTLLSALGRAERPADAVSDAGTPHLQNQHQ